MVPLTAGDTVELQGYFRVADGYFAADHTTFWGCKLAFDSFRGFDIRQFSQAVLFGSKSERQSGF